MRAAKILSIIVIAGVLHAQDGQGLSRPGWPCTAGRAVDPSYLEVSEGTGGQLFLFQKNEAVHASLVMTASHTHPAAVLRAVGNLNGTRDFEFPIDSSIDSLLFLVSLQCRNAIRISRPGGSELSQGDSAQDVELQAGRILRVDHPDTGQWRIRLTGTGLFVLSVLAKADVALTGITFSLSRDGSREDEPISRLHDPLYGIRQTLEARLSGRTSQVKMQTIDASGDPISDYESMESNAEGVYRIGITPQAGRFRIRVAGTDSSAWPFQRMHPILFRARSPR